MFSFSLYNVIGSASAIEYVSLSKKTCYVTHICKIMTSHVIHHASARLVRNSDHNKKLINMHVVIISVICLNTGYSHIILIIIFVHLYSLPWLKNIFE